MEGYNIEEESSKNMVVLFVLSLITLILSLLKLVTNTYLFIALFAIDFLLVGIVSTKAINPMLSLRQVIRKIVLILSFGLLFSLISTIVTYTMKMTVDSILVSLSLLSIFFIIVAEVRKESRLNRMYNPEEYQDKLSKRIIFVIILLCIVSYIGMEVPPFSVLPLWYGLCVPFILIIPGYFFINFLVPHIEELLLLERLGSAIFSSLIITSIIGFILTQMEGFLNMRHVSLILVIATLIIFLPMYYLRIKNLNQKEVFSDSRINKIFILITIVAICTVIASGLFVSTNSVTNPTSSSGTLYKGNTTFNVSGIHETPGNDGYYNFTNGDTLNLTVAIKNNEHANKDYTFRVLVVNDTGNNTISEQKLSLKEGESKKIEEIINMTSGKKDIQFILFNENDQPYKIRHLYVNVQ